MQTPPRLPCLAALLLLCLAACTSQPTGSVQFAASVQALSASDVTRVKVTVSASDMSPLIVELAQSTGSWGGLISNIPSGTNRTFLAEAFDSSGTLRFQGQTRGVSIVPNQTTAVALTLQQTPPPPSYGNEAPLIDSLVASSTSVQTGGSLSLTALSHDPNTGDALTLAWTATSGTFSNPTAATTSWTAPSSISIQTLTLTVTDSQGIAVSVSIAVNVISGAPTNAELDISFNLWPVVSQVTSTLNRLDAGQSTSLSALASDADGDALSYQWTSSCPGTWTNATSSAASFVPSSIPASDCNNCRLTVTVLDGRGGQITGSLNLCVAAASSTERFPPRFTYFQQSTPSISPGQTVAFDVTAMDPQDSSLTFAWTTNTGSLATAQSTATTSHVEWTAPSCAVTGVPPSVTAVVTNAYGISASIPFVPSGLPACTPGWTTAGSMAVARDNSTATLLSSGKILVLGGHIGGIAATAAAEVYDPVSGTWSATASMLSARFTHTATLLPNGKVLVSGGYSGGASVEVYNPASGTWSATASMRSAREAHMATLLPNGKVLVSGGYDRGPLASAEVYDPASGTWSATASMISGRWGHTATLLPSGKVLVSGGSINGYGTNNIASAEVYDPASGTWSAPPPWHRLVCGTWRHCCPTARCSSRGGPTVAATSRRRRCMTLPRAPGALPPRWHYLLALATGRRCCSAVRSSSRGAVPARPPPCLRRYMTQARTPGARPPPWPHLARATRRRRCPTARCSSRGDTTGATSRGRSCTRPEPSAPLPTRWPSPRPESGHRPRAESATETRFLGPGL